jgi:hypothetical protein
MVHRLLHCTVPLNSAPSLSCTLPPLGNKTAGVTGFVLEPMKLTGDELLMYTVPAIVQAPSKSKLTADAAVAFPAQVAEAGPNGRRVVPTVATTGPVDDGRQQTSSEEIRIK